MTELNPELVEERNQLAQALDMMVEGENALVEHNAALTKLLRDLTLRVRATPFMELDAETAAACENAERTLRNCGTQPASHDASPSTELVGMLIRHLEHACAAMVPAHWYPGSQDDWEENQRETRDQIVEMLRQLEASTQPASHVTDNELRAMAGHINIEAHIENVRGASHDASPSADVVERVARVLCALNFELKGAEGEFGTVDDCWFAFVKDAKAALEAKNERYIGHEGLSRSVYGSLAQKKVGEA